MAQGLQIKRRRNTHLGQNPAIGIAQFQPRPYRIQAAHMPQGRDDARHFCPDRRAEDAKNALLFLQLGTSVLNQLIIQIDGNQRFHKKGFTTGRAIMHDCFDTPFMTGFEGQHVTLVALHDDLILPVFLPVRIAQKALQETLQFAAASPQALTQKREIRAGCVEEFALIIQRHLEATRQNRRRIKLSRQSGQGIHSLTQSRGVVFLCRQHIEHRAQISPAEHGTRALDQVQQVIYIRNINDWERKTGGNTL